MSCGGFDGTTVAAHSDMLEHGKGHGIKAHDGMIAFLCASCHYEYGEGHRLTRDEKRLMFFRAMARTYMHLWDNGLIELTEDT